MIFTKDQTPEESIRSELESTRNSFHALVESLSEEDLREQSELSVLETDDGNYAARIVKAVNEAIRK